MITTDPSYLAPLCAEITYTYEYKTIINERKKNGANKLIQDNRKNGLNEGEYTEVLLNLRTPW